METRNFCIIAHIDHGKSTLADRLLEYTGTVTKREMKDQLLDQMDLERERGITIKLQPVRMEYAYAGQTFTLNLIDTPGHVDFAYEVSRSLAAVEGTILLVDATQGIQAQTLANLYLALEQNLAIIPAINKIDLPGARVAEVESEISNLLGCAREDICRVSAKTGEGIETLLEQVIKRIPPPIGKEEEPLQALIFDSLYDEFRGVVAYVRLFQGNIKKESKIFFKGTRTRAQALEVGFFKPRYTPSDALFSGDIGYIVTGLRDVQECRVGDTIVYTDNHEKTPALAGYKEIKPMVFAGIFCKDGDDFKRLREAVEKFKLNDAAFTFEPEHSPALGFGFRCGFLGLLHLEIVQERLHREYQLNLIVTIPSVAYRVTYQNKTEKIIHGPLELTPDKIPVTIEEPWMQVDIVTPESTIGGIMACTTERRGVYKNTEYLSSELNASERRVILRFELPLSAILVDFYDKIKSVSSGYASMNYDFIEYRSADVVRMDIFVAGSIVEELSSIVYEDQAYYAGRKIVGSLKTMLPRQMFEVKIQAAIGSNVIASERIAPMRKDVTVGLYGGDVTRKQKLLEKQKKGKQRMKSIGKVDIPPEAYLAVLKR